MMVIPYYKPEPHIFGWLQAFTLPSDIVLDVGSGDGKHREIGAAKYYSLDSWPLAEPDYLVDLNKIDLPTDREFDVILLMDLIEHLDKERSREILFQAQTIAKRAVVVLTPLKWNENREAFEEGFYCGNDHILHRSLWSLSDFDKSWVRVSLPSTQDCFFGYWINQ